MRLLSSMRVRNADFEKKSERGVSRSYQSVTPAGRARDSDSVEGVRRVREGRRGAEVVEVAGRSPVGRAPARRAAQPGGVLMVADRGGVLDLYLPQLQRSSRV